MNIQKSFPRLLLFVTGTLLTAACAAGGFGKGDIPHVWPDGTVAEYSFTTYQSQALEVPGQGEQLLESSNTIDFSIIPTGDRRFKLTFTDATLSSDAAAVGAPVPDISALVGVESGITLNERGEIVEATELADNSYVLGQGGFDSFREQLQMLFLYLPEARLKPGAEWSREFGYSVVQEDSPTLELSQVDRYTCAGGADYMGTPAWKITVISAADLAGYGDAGGQVMDLAMSGTGETTVYVAPGTAMILGAESRLTLTGGISVAGMDIPATIALTFNVNKK